ncbi:MAG: Ig-like domain-containing protein [Xanthomonadales bacterium]|nr:Ig-like domain-containing protein [Xanthomonadales bacterium]
MGDNDTRTGAAITAAGLFVLAGAGDLHSQNLVDARLLDGSNGFAIHGAEIFGGAGSAVDRLGDVNGDHIDDLVIGAPHVDSPLNSEGETYVIFGRGHPFGASIDISDLTGNNGFAISGIDPADDSGRSIGGAGDLNGDGINDILISAPAANPGVGFEGEVYVVFGSEQSFPANFNLFSLDGSNGFVINGVDANDFTNRVSTAGDINGDGLDDVIIGAHNATVRRRKGLTVTEFPIAGKSFVVFGSDQPFPASMELADLDGSNGFLIKGADAGDFSGFSVSGAGDVNGDGIDDVVIGAILAGPGNDPAGECYVVFGSDQPFPASLDLRELDGSNGFVMSGVEPGGFLGNSVSNAGDVNSDGIDDVIVGAPLVAAPGSRGESYVLFGSDSPFPASLPLADLDGSNGFVIRGPRAFTYTGTSVSAAGDVNGDGIDDAIVGSSITGGQVGESYVVFGRNQPFPASLELSGLTGRDGFVVRGVASNGRFGVSVNGAGDVNNDGLDDVIIGEPDADIGVAGEGASYVLFGNAGPLALGNESALPSTLEDSANPTGGRVDLTVAAQYLDTDSLGGLAVIDNRVSADHGTWQYRNSGSDWQSVPVALSDSNALVLDALSLIRFVPAPDFVGRPGELVVRLWDGRWRTPGVSVDIVDAVGALGGFANDENLLDIVVDVTAVNDPPALTASSPPAVSEDSGAATFTNWSEFSPGPTDESAQFALGYTVDAVSRPELFLQFPAVDISGNLTFTVAPDANGSSTFDVRVADSGGTANGGDNLSTAETFTVTVLPVNDPPVFQADDPPAVAMDSGPQSVASWASFGAGASNESGQSVSFAVLDVSEPELFSVIPEVDDQGNLHYTPAPGVSGLSTFSVQISDDGGTANGGQDTSAPQQFAITVSGDAVFGDGFEDR